MLKMDVSTNIMQLERENPPLHPSTISSPSEFQKAWSHLLQFPEHTHQTSITNLNHKFNLFNVFVHKSGWYFRDRQHCLLCYHMGFKPNMCCTKQPLKFELSIFILSMSQTTMLK